MLKIPLETLINEKSSSTMHSLLEYLGFFKILIFDLIFEPYLRATLQLQTSVYIANLLSRMFHKILHTLIQFLELLTARGHLQN